MEDKAMDIKCGNPNCRSTLKVVISTINPEKPLVKCPKCKRGHRVKLPQQQNETKGKAWLIRHTENQPLETYELKMGKNTIGRKAPDPNYPIPDISITKENDPYVSRGIHCTLEIIEAKGHIDAIISDNNSTNGTFINDKTYRFKPGDEEYLKDGETIQVGRTKFVLKIQQSVTSKNEAQTLVQQTNYSKTIIIN